MRGLLIGLCLLSLSAVRADLIISQYYEGESWDKYIELFNPGQSSLALDGYRLAIFFNENAEGYKTDGASPGSNWDLSGFSIGAGATLLLSHPSAENPAYARAEVDGTHGTVINFNGNDSVALYNSDVYDLANLVDAIGFTDEGYEGADTSWVRISRAAGWSTTPGSNVNDFTAAWKEYSPAAVAAAQPGAEERLGFSAIPEPGTAAMIGLFGLLLLPQIGNSKQRADGNE